jgi:hypothetical protein
MNIATEEFVTRQLASAFSNNFFTLSASRVKNGEERLGVVLKASDRTPSQADAMAKVLGQFLRQGFT